jgi:hypothetical protein
MTKLTPVILLAGLLSGCVTSNDHYSQTTVRSIAAPRQAAAAVQTSKMRDRVAPPVMLGAAY